MTNKIKILFLGDIVGRAGRLVVQHYIANLSQDEKPDFIIANVENASHGFGLTEKNHNELISFGIDCFTSGNHIWDKKEIFKYIDQSDRLIRPLNYPDGTLGVGSRIFDTDKGKIGVINILGRTFMNIIDSPWTIVEKEIEKIKKITPIVLIDFHAEATAEKVCMGIFVSKLGASGLFGTHTHVQSADEKIINNCCAYITDAGFCGDISGVIGMNYETSFKKLVTAIPDRLEVSSSEQSQINGVFVIVDSVSGFSEEIKRINLVINNNEVNNMITKG